MVKFLHFKTMALLLLMIVGASSAWAEDVVYKTALFGSSYNSENQDYISSFEANNDGFVVTATNFNNNKNGWTNSAGNGQIKCGRKNNTSVGTITTNDAIDAAITKVVVTIDAITATKVNSIKLYTSSNGSSWTEAGSFTKATGAQAVTLSSPTANFFYKIEFDCASGSSNGLVTISKVEYYKSAPITNPTLSIAPVSASEFTYEVGVGPSEEQLFEVTGTNLTSDVTATVTGDFEITDDQTYTSSLTLSSGDVVSVRMKDGLNIGTYNGTLTFTSTGAASQTINLTGTVTAVIPPSVVVSEETINATADEVIGTIDVTYTKIDFTNTPEVQFYESNGVTSANYDWIDAEINSENVNKVDYMIDSNTGAERTAYMKVYAIDINGNNVYSELITITQTAYVAPTSFSWNLRTNSYTSATEDLVTWNSTYATMTNSKGTSSTVVNNYLGGDSNNRTSSRFYKGNTLTITPADGYGINSVVFTATSESYANALQNSTWTNASASVSGTTVTVTPENGNNALSATIGGTCGFTEVTVNFTRPANTAPVWDELPTPTVTIGNPYVIDLADYITAGIPTPTISLTSTTANANQYTFEGSTLTYQPTVAGQYSFTFTASNSEGSANITLTLTVNEPASASLPFSFNEGKNNLPSGLTQSGLGSDYNTDNTKLKFDNTGDNLVLKVNSAPGTISFSIQGNSFSGGTFKVQVATNGYDYTDLATYTSLSTEVVTLTNNNADVRYIKWVYTTKDLGNVGLGNINVSATKVVSAAGWATFVPTYHAQFAEGDAYVVSSVNATSATLSGVTSVPANTPVLLKGAGTKNISLATSTPSAPTNQLRVVGANETITSAYVLANHDNVTAFYKYQGNGLDAGQVYLPVPANGTRMLSFSFDEVTGVNAVNGEGFMVNGPVYDLQGRRVAQPQKGLYIVNGRKVVVK